MIPLNKVQDLIIKHDDLEKELSSGEIDKKLFAKGNQRVFVIRNIITYAREFIKFEGDKKLEQIIQDKNSDSEMVEMAEKDLSDLKRKKKNMKIARVFLLPKDEDDEKMQ